jgi:hypothetical protein
MFALFPATLRNLSFDDCDLSSRLPDVVLYLSMLTDLTIRNDRLEPEDVEALGSLTKLVNLDLRNTSFERTEMTKTLRRLTRLRNLDVDTDGKKKENVKWASVVKKWNPRLEIVFH